jgi:hypothetical protein
MNDTERLTEVEKRCLAVEQDLAQVKTDVHKIKNTQQIAAGEMTTLKSTVAQVKTNTDQILSVVDGGKKVFGFAMKHWKTALTFGAGLMTAAGIGNPEMTKFISDFFHLST